MAASTRRGFLGTIAAGIVAGAGCAGEEQSSRNGSPPPHNMPPSGPAPPATTDFPDGPDKPIASYFTSHAKDFDPEQAAGSDFVAINFYGLFLYHFNTREALLPNSQSGMLPTEPKIPAHRALLWSRAAVGQTELRTVYTDGSLRAWDLTGKSVRFEWVYPTALNTRLADDEPKKIEENMRHPWRKFQHVAMLCSWLGRTVIDDAKRKDSQRVAARVKLLRFNAIPGSPWSAAGAVSEWQFKDAEQAYDTPKAMTDNITFIGPAPANTGQKPSLLRLWISNLDGTDEKPLPLTYPGTPLALAITHAAPTAEENAAHTQKDVDMGKLHHSRAYGLLCEGVTEYAKFPIPHFVRGIHGEKSPPPGRLSSLEAERSGRSSEDGHCECAWCD